MKRNPDYKLSENAEGDGAKRGGVWWEIRWMIKILMRAE